MLSSQLLVSRRGPLAKVWLAAHFERKLTRSAIFSTDISASVAAMMHGTSVPLRVSGQLMVGLVRIFSRKVRFLMTDATEAMWKMRLAFRPGSVDLPETTATTTAPVLGVYTGGAAVDSATVGGAGIDDHRHFGQIAPEYAYPLLDNLAFASQLLPPSEDSFAAIGRVSGSGSGASGGSGIASVTRRWGRPGGDSLEEDAMSLGGGGGMGRVSDIEFMRGGTVLPGDFPPSTPMSHRHTSSTIHSDGSAGIGPASGLLNRFDDDLPAFDMGGGFGEEAMFANLRFDDFFLRGGANRSTTVTTEGVTPQPTGGRRGRLSSLELSGVGSSGGSIGLGIGDADLTFGREVSPIAEEGAPSPSSHSPKGDVPRPLPRDAFEDLAEPATTRISKKSRLVIDERIELPERAIRQRITEVRPILRRRIGDQLPFELGLRDDLPDVHIIEEDTLKFTGTKHSSELSNLASLMFHNQLLPHHRIDSLDAALSSATKRRRVAVATPSPPETPLDSNVPVVDEIEWARAPDSHASSAIGRSGFRESLTFGGESSAGLLPPIPTSLGIGGTGDSDSDQIAREAGFASDSSGAGIAGSGWKPWQGTDEDGEDVLRPGELTRQMETLFQPLDTRPDALTSDHVVLHSKRTKAMLNVIEEQLFNHESVSFSSLVAGCSRRVVARCLLEVLQLKTWGAIELQQNRPYGTISLSTPTESRKDPVESGSHRRSSISRREKV